MLSTERRDPGVATVDVDLLGGTREVGVGERAKRHRDRVRLSRWFPEDRRAARRAEAEDDRGAVVRRPLVPAGLPRRRDRFAWEEGSHAKDAAGSPLAFRAVAERDEDGITRASCPELSAGTRREPSRHSPLLVVPPRVARHAVAISGRACSKCSPCRDSRGWCPPCTWRSFRSR